MHKLILLIGFLFVSLNFYSQNKPIDALFIDKKLKDLKHLDLETDQKEKVLRYLYSRAKAINYNLGMLDSGNELMNIYLFKFDYKNAVKLGQELKKIIVKKDNSILVAGVYSKNALSLGYLGFDALSREDFKMGTSHVAHSNDSNDAKNYALSLLYRCKTICYMNHMLQNTKYRDSVKLYLGKSLEKIKLVSDQSKEVADSLKYDDIAFLNIRLGIFYLEQDNKPKSLTLAEKHLLESQKLYQKYKPIGTRKMMLMNQLSWLYLEKKDYKRSIEYAKMALALEKQHTDCYHRVESFEFLSNAYAAMGDKENTQFYMKQYSLLKDSITLAEKNTSNNSMQIILKESKSGADEKWMLNIKILLAVILMIGLILFVLWRRNQKLLHSKYEKIIARLNTTAESGTGQEDPGLERKFSIQDATINDLLSKLDNFEKSERFLRKDMSLSYLATYLGTNPNYLSAILNQHKGKNFNNYINQLRINYLVEKLYRIPVYREYKIAYLSEYCGFTSRDVFGAAFKKETGMTPSYFIKQLKTSTKTDQ